MELLAGDRLGKYEVVGRLAAGGMAEVYLARILGHGGFAKPVALKRMLPSLASEAGFRQMFMQEAALAARLNHPHVVQIFDFAEEGGELYLAMEFVHGVTLRRLHLDALTRSLAAPSLRLPPMLAAYVARCVASALAYAWGVPDDRGAPLHLIHRDVSPHNVLLSYEGAVKLADFGIAKPAGLHTSAGTLKGKLAYMAPEQISCGRLDARTDVFALGIVLYEAVMRRASPLFGDKDQASVAKAVKGMVIPVPARIDPDFPKQLSALIMKALERDPAKRFQTAGEFADALGESLHHEAKGPLEYDLVAFMRRVYGEPKAIPGPASSPPRPVPGADPRRELDRIADDAQASTVSHDYVDGVRAAAPAPAMSPVAPAASQALRPTVLDRARVPREALEAALLEEQARLAEEKKAQPARPGTRRIWLVPSALAGAAAVALVIFVAQRRPEGQAAPVEGLELVQPLPAKILPSPVARAPEPAPAVKSEPTAPAPVPAPAPAEPPHVAATAPAPKAVAAPPPPAVRHPEKKAAGTLVVYVKPWVHAWVDAEPFTGSTAQEAAPRLERPMAAGRHVLHLRDGDGNEKKLEVVIAPERQTVVEGVFDRLDVH